MIIVGMEMFKVMTMCRVRLNDVMRSKDLCKWYG